MAHEPADEQRTGAFAAAREFEMDALRAFEFARHSRNRAALELAETGRRQIARNAVDARRIAAIGRERDVDHGIVQMQRMRRGLARHRIGRKLDDAFMLVRQQQLTLRTQHAARFHAADGRDLERFTGHRNDDARPREHGLHARARVRRAAHDLDDVVARIDHAELQLVGIGMFLRRHDVRDDEILQARAFVFHRFDFEADAGQRIRDGLRVRVRLEMFLEPGERELHRLSPPSKVGMSSAAKPKCLSQRRSDSKNGRKSGAPYFSIAMRSRPKPKAKP